MFVHNISLCDWESVCMYSDRKCAFDCLMKVEVYGGGVFCCCFLAGFRTKSVALFDMT